MNNLFATYVENRQWVGTLKFAIEGSWGPKGKVIELAQELHFPLLPQATIEEEEVKLNPFSSPTLLSANPTQDQFYELALDLGEFPKLYKLIVGICKFTPLKQVYELTSVYSVPADESFKLTIEVEEGKVTCRLIRAEWIPNYDIANEFAGWELKNE